MVDGKDEDREPAPPREVDDADADRDAILARRRLFVAAALASLAGATACRDPIPGPCLSAKPVPTEAGEPEAEPQPCLKVAVSPERVTEAGASEAGSKDPGAPDAATPPVPPKPPPMPCLTPVARPLDAGGPPKPPPAPCLSVVAPRVDPTPPPAKKD